MPIFDTITSRLLSFFLVSGELCEAQKNFREAEDLYKKAVAFEQHGIEIGRYDTYPRETLHAPVSLYHFYERTKNSTELKNMKDKYAEKIPYLFHQDSRD